MKVVSWNCRGLGGTQKLEVIKRFKTMESASIILIQETKKSAEDSLETIKSIWTKGTGIATNAHGASGGLLTLWNSEQYEMLEAIEDRNWLLIKLEDKTAQFFFGLGMCMAQL